ncbi:MAG TPA: 3-hydroxybutyryl-CoA dehydrogenase [Candidatus Polarisedimenticolia bacterium]|nr:3-hydroxybutyryl-CoA dehydrogenase [Candidatus Polarisedimenticolia bacterium]
MREPATRIIGVVGAGTMGHGIAHVAARAGFEVVLTDVSEDLVTKGLETIDREMRRAVEKGRMSADEKAQAFARIRGGAGTAPLARTDLVVEAIVEKEEAKLALFAELDRACGPATILASNTSSISLTRIAAATRRPERVVGMHFMNPVPVMALVEVIRGLKTSDDTVIEVTACARKMGKTTVEVKDYPGFVSNRVLMPMINEAITALMEGVASAEDIDTVMKLGMNHPMGPLALADLIGLDTCLNILEVLHEGFGDPRYRPCPLLRNMVAAGDLGRKTGRGFYLYNAT